MILMTLKISDKANRNYLAKVVRLENIRKHSNADRLQVVSIDGNNAITSLHAKDGMLYVYFPLECAINKDYLSYSNSFEDKTLNKDTSVKGYFSKKGRVRAQSFRGEKSEGYIVPVEDISDWLQESQSLEYTFSDKDVNVEFDLVEGVKICEKYINYDALRQLKQQSKKEGKKAKESRLIESQFSFHIDTPQLKKFVHNIQPDDYIQITRKIHGTSVVLSNILCVKPLNFFEKLLKKLGVSIVDSHYDLVYSSRKVVKNGYLDPKEANYNHYYSSDVWGDCARKYEACLKNGITLYGEIVGYTKDGTSIQKGYDYDCQPGQFDFYVYRATITSTNGDVYEMSPKQMEHYCNHYGIKTVPELYYGKAKELYNIPTNDHWHEKFLKNLCEYFLEQKCDMCSNDVPDEGICLRVDKPLQIDVYKLKSFAFLERETKLLDKGDVDMETQESEEVPV